VRAYSLYKYLCMLNIIFCVVALLRLCMCQQVLTSDVEMQEVNVQVAVRVSLQLFLTLQVC